MNQKKARMLRKLTNYNVRNDPQKDRKYAVVTCSKVTIPGLKPVRARTGYMIATKAERLYYRLAKKRYREGLL